jgi:superfamily II DNA or RNA helicase
MYKPFPYQQELIDKARQSFVDGHHSVLIQSPAGSGKSIIIAEIARLAIEKGGHVMFTVHRKELIEQIKDTFTKDDIDLSHTTIMTVRKIANRLDKLPKPSLIITDESHHSLAKTYRKIYDFYQNVPRLGFTATPWRLSGKGLHDVYDDMIEGPSVQWLIDYHYLAPFDEYGFPANTEMLKKSSTGDYTNKSMDDFASHIIYGDIVKNWQDKAQGRKTIIYCHAVWFSQEVAQAFNDVGIPAAHADAKTSEGEREQIMTDFRNGKIRVLCNVDLVSEGFNVPDCSCVVLLRPTASLVLYIQQAMRAMRYRPHKKAVIIDQVSNFEKFGTPVSPHDWSLKDRKKKKRINNSSGPTIRTCSQCFAVIPANCRVCPICGAEIEVEKQEIQIDKQAKLKKINGFNPVVVNYIVTRKPSELNSPAEIKAYAKAKGYRPGWIWHQMKSRGWVK